MNIIEKHIGDQPVTVGHFKLKIKDTDKAGRTIKHGNSKTFEYPFTKGYPMIYLVSHANEIIYVGYTHDLLSRRLSGGLSPGKYDVVSKNRIISNDGYSGYKWRFFEEVELIVFVFNKVEIKKVPKGNQDLSLRNEHRSFVHMFENIESEIVFQIKSKSYWPKYQSEIHFYSNIENGRFSQNPKKSIDIIGLTEDLIAKEILKIANNINK